VTVRVDGTGGTARVVVLGTGATPDPGVRGPRPALRRRGNVALADGLGVVSLPIAPGTYDVYAMRGLDASLDRESIVVASADVNVTLDVATLGVVPDAAS
jgi:hypothetical protein